jgi:hypothetical protein
LKYKRNFGILTPRPESPSFHTLPNFPNMEQPQTEEDEDSRCVILALGDSKSLKAAYKLEKLTNGIETELYKKLRRDMADILSGRAFLHGLYEGEADTPLSRDEFDKAVTALIGGPCLDAYDKTKKWIAKKAKKAEKAKLVAMYEEHSSNRRRGSAGDVYFESYSATAGFRVR